MRLERAVRFIERESHMNFPNRTVFADIIKCHLHASELLGFPHGLGEILELESDMPSRDEGMQLSVQGGEFLGISSRQVKWKLDFSRLRTLGHFDVLNGIWLSDRKLASGVCCRMYISNRLRQRDWP